MGKPTVKKKLSGIMPIDGNSKRDKSTMHGPKKFDQDTAIFMDMANDMKGEGNKLFQKRDYDGALVMYEKALKLLPRNHIDVAPLHSNIAACYMQMGPEEYQKAIHECNMALEVSPKYTKALLKRARCFEVLNRLELASRDIDAVLKLEPNNLNALEVSDKIKKALEVKGIQLNNKVDALPIEIISVRGKHKKKKSKKALLEMPIFVKPIAEKPTPVEEEPLKAVKLVFGEDIRFAQIPKNCSLSQLRKVVQNRFPSLKAVLIKYRDREGDLVTITTSEELSWAKDSADPQSSLRFYINEVKPEHEPKLVDGSKTCELQVSEKNFNGVNENGNLGDIEGQENSCCINEWIVKFALLFKNHVGIDSDEYLDLHQLGMKLCYEAMEDTVTSEEAMEIFEIASRKFQEMAALALFNRGNVHMSRARKRLLFTDNDSKGVALTQVNSLYDWAKGEYQKAGLCYEEAMKIKPDFYEGLLALAHQQFEQAKLTWYFANGNKVDLNTWPSKEVFDLFNNAEDNMEKGTMIWEEIEEKHMKARLKPIKDKEILERIGLGQFFKQLSADEAVEISSNMRSQLHILWGKILYERSIMEFKQSLPTWEECLMTAVEKFKVAGASPTDIAVMIKNHSANETTQEGLGFKIDEIVQAWNEMHDAKNWMSVVPSFRLEPLFHRKSFKLHHSLEHA